MKLHARDRVKRLLFLEPLGPTSVPHNNGLHQTGRGGVAFAFRRRPVVEARPAGEAGCSTGQA